MFEKLLYGKGDEEYLDVSEYLQEDGPEQIAFMPTLSHVSATWFSREDIH